MCPLLTFHIEFFIICLPHVRDAGDSRLTAPVVQYSYDYMLRWMSGEWATLLTILNLFSLLLLFFFNFHLCLFYLYQWWLTFKLLFCVFFISLFPLRLMKFFSLLNGRQWAGKSKSMKKKESREQAKVQRHNLFIYDFVSIIPMEIFVSMSDSIKYFSVLTPPLRNLSRRKSHGSK